MHIWTHLPPKYEAMENEKGLYGAGMTQLDDNIGVLLKKIDDLGIADNTIVIFTSDNGAEVMSWPDGGTTPFQGEKNTSWEGGYRVPFVIRWPGVIKPGTVINGTAAHEDWATTLLAAAGVPDVKEKLLTGYQAGSMTYKVHSGRLQPDALSQGRHPSRPSPRVPLLDGRRRTRCLRYDKWKALFLEQPAEGFSVWETPFRSIACSQAVRPPRRSVRAGRDGIDRLLALADRPHLPAYPGASLCRAVADQLQAISPTPETGQLQPRPGHEADVTAAANGGN